MGQKLKLAESVERGLEDVGCPLPLRAHQIVGLDTARVSRGAMVDETSDGEESRRDDGGRRRMASNEGREKV